MVDSINFKVEATLREEFMRAVYPVIHAVIAGRHEGPVAPVFGCWFLKLHSEPHQLHGYGTLWKATHRTLGITFGFYGNKLVFVSASLPRVLFGTNARHLETQDDINAAIEVLLTVMDEVADLRAVVEHVKFTRIDLVRPLLVPLADVKRTFRYAYHPCFRGEPIVRGNSLLFDGTNTQVFFYDKERKEKLAGAGNATRCEVRLRNAEEIAKYPGLVGPGLRIDFDIARAAYRDVLSKFPPIAQVPKQDLYAFLAALAASDRAYQGVPLLDLYFEMCCPTAESAARTRREVAKRMPAVTKLSLHELLP